MGKDVKVAVIFAGVFMALPLCPSPLPPASLGLSPVPSPAPKRRHQ